MFSKSSSSVIPIFDLLGCRPASFNALGHDPNLRWIVPGWAFPLSSYSAIVIVSLPSALALRRMSSNSSSSGAPLRLSSNSNFMLPRLAEQWLYSLYNTAHTDCLDISKKLPCLLITHCNLFLIKLLCVFLRLLIPVYTVCINQSATHRRDFGHRDRLCSRHGCKSSWCWRLWRRQSNDRKLLSLLKGW